MGEIFANELSFVKEGFSEYNNIHMLGDVYRGLQKYGIATCWISYKGYMTIRDIIREYENYRNILDFAWSFFKAPYEGSETIDSIGDSYLMHEWVCNGVICEGLAFAFLSDSITLSVNPNIWKETVWILRDGEKISVRNISSVAHLEIHSQRLAGLMPVELVMNSISPSKKPIHLRDDHGKDKLLAFSKKLLRSPYVIGVINSLPFNPDNKRFIKNIHEDGIIDCVLYWIDEGIGVVVKTTGRNMTETKEIAKILTREYGQR